MNDNDKWNPIFNPRDGDPHHIAAQDSEDYLEWPDLLIAGLAVAAFCAAIVGIGVWASI